MITQKQYEYSKNLRIALLTANALLIVVLGFLLFQQKDINAQNILSLIILLVNTIYLIFNKPTPPPTI
ncbi:MAG: hypothetical protein ABI643_02780 [Candidatus Doudnabacteria bacterium]